MKPLLVNLILGLISTACAWVGPLYAVSAVGEVRLLKYPYPYQGAVTINSDIDNATVEKFNSVHALINSTDLILPDSETANHLFSTEVKSHLSREKGILGFGLPLADSFWLYSEKLGVFKGFDYDLGEPIVNSHSGKDMRFVVDEWFQRGWIDTLHSPGPGDIRRGATKAGLSWLAQQPHRATRIWVNHSTSNTPANIGPETRTALDLIPRNLIKCVTALVSMAGADSFIRRFVVKPRPDAFPYDQRMLGWALSILTILSILFFFAVMAVKRFRRWPYMAASIASFIAILLILQVVPIRYHRGDDMESPYYCADLARDHGFKYFWLLQDFPGYRAQIPDALRLPENSVFGRSSVLSIAQLDDGVSVLIFPRCYKGRNTDRGLELLTLENLEDLCHQEGTAIIYIHWTNRTKEVFTWEGLKGLQRLSEFYRSGRIWVAPASAILDFTFARTFLVYTAEESGERIVIKVSGIASPVGQIVVPTLTNLRGISFECPSEREVVLELAGKEVPVNSLEYHRAGNRLVIKVPN